MKLQEADFRTLGPRLHKAEAEMQKRRRTSKEKKADEAKKYQANKKHAKLMTEVVMEENCTNDESGDRLGWFRGLGYKRDDAADALLQGIYKARDLLSRKTHKKPVTPRRASGVRFKRPKTARSKAVASARKRTRQMAKQADDDLCKLE